MPIPRRFFDKLSLLVFHPVLLKLLLLELLNPLFETRRSVHLVATCSASDITYPAHSALEIRGSRGPPRGSLQSTPNSFFVAPHLHFQVGNLLCCLFIFDLFFFDLLAGIKDHLAHLDPAGVGEASLFVHLDGCVVDRS